MQYLSGPHLRSLLDTARLNPVQRQEVDRIANQFGPHFLGLIYTLVLLVVVPSFYKRYSQVPDSPADCAWLGVYLLVRLGAMGFMGFYMTCSEAVALVVPKILSWEVERFGCSVQCEMEALVSGKEPSFAEKQNAVKRITLMRACLQTTIQAAQDELNLDWNCFFSIALVKVACIYTVACSRRLQGALGVEPADRTVLLAFNFLTSVVCSKVLLGIALPGDASEELQASLQTPQLAFASHMLWGSPDYLPRLLDSQPLILRVLGFGISLTEVKRTVLTALGAALAVALDILLDFRAIFG